MKTFNTFNTVAAVCCCGRDQHLLDEFIANWNHVSDVPIVVLSDTSDPVTDARGCEVVDYVWPNYGPIAPHVLKGLKDVATLKGANTVIKLDCDIAHIRAEWASMPTSAHVVGFKHHTENNFYGGAVRYSVEGIDLLLSFGEWDKLVLGEDAAISEACRRIKVDVEYLESNRVCGVYEGVNENPQKCDKCEWVHCGQYGKDRRGRRETLQSMIAVNNYFHPRMERKTLIASEAKLDLRNYFGEVGVISLDCRKDRLQAFQRRAAVSGVTGFEQTQAVHGDACPHPDFWRAGNGAWGCLMSHVRFVQDAIMGGAKNFLVFEDDAVFSDDFTSRLPRIMCELANVEWDMLYLGGQHLYVETAPPWPFREGLVRCNNVNRTHAFAVNGRFMVEYLKHITDFRGMMEMYVPPSEGTDEWFPHIDHWLGTIHRQKVVLAVDPWICGQAAGVSGVNGGDYEENWWNDKGWGK